MEPPLSSDPAAPAGDAPRRRRWPILAGTGALALAGVAAALLYGTGAGGNSGACAASRPTAARLAPFAKGEVAAMSVRPDPGALPNLSFAKPDGAPVTLADFRGRKVLLNLWATWCAPCRKEMPALDALQAQLGGADFEVVSINIDQRGADRPAKFLDDIGVARLVRYADPSARVFSDLKSAGKAFGMPTTILIDANGCELANLAGPAEWASGDAVAFVKAALGR